MENAQVSTVRLLLSHGADVTHDHYRILSLADARGDAVPGANEILGLLSAEALRHADAPASVYELRGYYDARVKNLHLCSPEKRSALLLECGIPSDLLSTLAGIGLLHCLFEPETWPDTAQAMEFHRCLREALPDYRTQIDAIDMTGFVRNHLPGMAEKLRGRTALPTGKAR